jgi:hypothetical protein
VHRLLISLCLTALFAAPPARTQKEISVPLWNGSKSGEADGVLKPQDLRARLEGVPARIRTVLGPEDDLMLLLVTDVVGDISLVAPAKRALMSEIQKLTGRAFVGLMQAQDGLKVLLDPAADTAKVAATIESLPVSGKPGLLDTVETVAKIADAVLAKSNVRVAVFYVTDSDVREYREDFTNPVINYSDPHDLSRRFPEGLVREKISKLDAALAALQAPVFVVHLDYRSDRLNEAYQAGLLQLATTTGGSSTFCRSSAEIATAIAKTIETITALYRVDIELPARTPKMLQVQLESAGRSLSYRQRFLLDRR